ncbi:unnamed protein product, partial [Nesidiocoris tenuis]
MYSQVIDLWALEDLGGKAKEDVQNKKISKKHLGNLEKQVSLEKAHDVYLRQPWKSTGCLILVLACTSTSRSYCLVLPCVPPLAARNVRRLPANRNLHSNRFRVRTFVVKSVTSIGSKPVTYFRDRREHSITNFLLTCSKASFQTNVQERVNMQSNRYWEKLPKFVWNSGLGSWMESAKIAPNINTVRKKTPQSAGRPFKAGPIPPAGPRCRWRFVRETSAVVSRSLSGG